MRLRRLLHARSSERASRSAPAPAEPRALGYTSRLRADPVITGYSLLLACSFSVALTLILFPPARRQETLEQTVLRVMRFGYPGPTRYEREIRVRLSNESPSLPARNRLLGSLRRVPDVPTGDAGPPTPPGSRRDPKRKGPAGFGGLSSEDLSASMPHRRFNLPTVQSEDLVIVTLVKPEYPREAIQRGIEGRVELLALVDTLGAVNEVEIVRSAGHLLDAAAAKAVKLCRFLPCKLNGRVQAVYADFKFNFTFVER